MNDDDVEEVRNHHYATPQSPTFELQLSRGTVKSVNGVMKLTDKEDKELLKLLRSGRPDIQQHMIKLDYAAAERIAKEYLAKQQPVAHQGLSHSQSGAEKAGHLVTEAVRVPGDEVKTSNGMSLAEKIRARTGEGNAATIIPDPAKPEVIETDAVHAADLENK